MKLCVINETWFDFFTMFCYVWCKSICKYFDEVKNAGNQRCLFISGLSKTHPISEKYMWKSSIFEKVIGER